MFHSLLSFMMFPFPGFWVAVDFYDLALMQPTCSLAFSNKKPERGSVNGVSLRYKTARPALQGSATERGVHACLSPNLKQNILSKCCNLVPTSEAAGLPTAFLFQGIWAHTRNGHASILVIWFKNCCFFLLELVEYGSHLLRVCGPAPY